MKHEPPLHTGKVQIGLAYYPQRSASYANWIEGHVPVRHRGRSLWAQFVEFFFWRWQ